MKKSLRIFLSGSVQPAFFNQFVKGNADQLKLRGFVRNLEDGRIEIFIEGDSKSADSMLEICKKGPKHSLIRNVDFKETKFQDFKDFRILDF